MYDCLPYFKQILNEIPLNNLLVRSCSIYVENQFIVAGLKALAVFTFKVTMPYLNFVERGSQGDLIEKLPQLFKDLSEAKLDTMAQYKVDWTHINVTSSQDPLTELEELMLQKMCLKSAKGVKVQCSREYWEDANEADPRATQLHLLQPDEHKHLPTNNLVTET